MTINFENLSSIHRNLNNFSECNLLIVSKNQTTQDISSLLSLGYRIFGENRVQEAEKKFNDNLFSHYPDLKLHLIGPLQSNKVHLALNRFNTIQTLDREKIIDAIAKEIRKTETQVKTKNFFIQINIGEENQKSGIPPLETKRFYEYAIDLKLNIVGFMCIPPQDSNPKEHFQKMLKIKNSINPKLLLSMGMSNDYLAALELGSNIIRVGSKIFQ